MMRKDSGSGANRGEVGRGQRGEGWGYLVRNVHPLQADVLVLAVVHLRAVMSVQRSTHEPLVVNKPVTQSSTRVWGVK